MESSLRMRLDNGIPLTPKLLGYRHDGDGNLVVNLDEAPTVKLAFYMYLYGYSTQQIADAFTALGRRSYLGNTKWTSGGILQILRNERHCGDVLTRKTYTPNYLTHLAKKNRGQRPQSRYLNHHEAIISRDDFNAVQQMLEQREIWQPLHPAGTSGHRQRKTERVCYHQPPLGGFSKPGVFCRGPKRHAGRYPHNRSRKPRR